MTLTHRFKTAGNLDSYRIADPEPSERRCLLVSVFNLNHFVQSSLPLRGGILRVGLDKGYDVDETLNIITKWMRDHDVLNQHRHHDHLGGYKICFHYLDEGAVYPSMTHEFTLRDYVFAGNDGNHPGNFDGLMVMLDRDVLAKAMRESLLEEDSRYNIPERQNAAILWREYIRQCSHPDYRREMAGQAPEAIYS